MIRAVFAALLAVLLVAAPARAQDDAPPDVSAPSAIVMEASTGDVLFQRDATERRPIASTTKLMTALLTMEHSELSDIVPASDYIASPIESRLDLRPGEKMSVADLLRGLMLESANDAAVTLGEHVSGSTSKFVKLMNRRARELKLRDTHYTNPIGLDAPGNYSSAYDLARLAVKLRKHSFIRKIADRRSATLSTGRPRPPVENRNTLLGKDPSVDGLKTGHTDSAGYCLATSANRSGMRLISIVMGARSIKAREDASAALLSYGYTFFETVRVKAARELILKPRVYKSAAESAELGVPYDVYATVGRGQGASLKTAAHLTAEPLIAPLAAGTAVGEFTVTDAGGGVIARAPLVPFAAVPLGGLWTRMVDSIALWFH